MLLALLAGCSSDRAGGPAERRVLSRDAPTTAARAARPAAELVAAVAAYRARVVLPRAGDPEFLEPPIERELGWINDRAIPLAQRLEQGQALFEDSKAIMRRYGERDLADVANDPERASDSAETVRWMESVVRQFGRLTSALVDEFLPTLSPQDPTYAVRIEGLDKVRIGSSGMLQGGLITLRARRSPLPARRHLAAAWRLHAPRYAAIWQPAQCAQLVAWIREVSGTESDPALRADLDAVATSLGSCAGSAPR
jgi:hypothetical protein